MVRGTIFRLFVVCKASVSYKTNEIRDAFEQYFKEFNQQSGKEYAVAASIGIYITNENDVFTFEELVEKSDRLMYEEKERRKKNSR